MTDTIIIWVNGWHLFGLWVTLAFAITALNGQRGMGPADMMATACGGLFMSSVLIGCALWFLGLFGIEFGSR